MAEKKQASGPPLSEVRDELTPLNDLFYDADNVLFGGSLRIKLALDAVEGFLNDRRHMIIFVPEVSQSGGNTDLF